MHELVILIAEYLIVVSVIITAGFWLYRSNSDKKHFVIIAIVASVITLVLAKLGSTLFYNPRPFVVGHFTPYFTHAGDNGFPSDHTLLASLLAFVVMLYSRRLGWLLLALAVAIGGSRVIAGVHHSIDIIGAIVCAAVGVGLAICLDTYLTKRSILPKKN